MNLTDISLENAILALFKPESINQAEISLEIYFKNPNVLELIKPLLLSSNIRIRQSALIFLPRIIQYFQIHSQPLPITLSQTLWEVFLVIDDPSCLLTTWPIINPILHLINPDSFIESILSHFQICCEHNKIFHAIILGSKIISSCQIHIPTNLISAIHTITMMIIDTFSLITDDFSRLYMIRKTFRIHLSLIQLSYLSFDLTLGHQYFKLLSTIQFENIHNNHLLFKSWRLTFDLI
jgi:hypothetical protein